MPGKKREKKVELIRTPWGFYQYQPLPNEAELRAFYADKYYLALGYLHEDNQDAVQASYTEEEVSWLRLRSWISYRKIEQMLPGKSPVTLLDVGCGEGWLMDIFYSNGHSVMGLDFSKAGIEKLHPHLLYFFEQGNIYDLLDHIVNRKEQFDVISLCNVIEHVSYPVQLLQNVKQIMHPGSLLALMVPNDFSHLQKHLLKRKFVKEEWWLCYPEHISYFNKESMCNLLKDLGFEIKSIIADHPIDLNLLNDNSNYVNDRSKGKNTQLFRVRADNFLGSIDREKLLGLYEILGSMGVGRNLFYVCSLLK